MSFGIGLGGLILKIQSCLKTYQKITAQEDQIDDIQDRIQEVLTWLIPIDRHLNTKYGPASYYPETPTLISTVDKMTTSAEEISRIFQHFYIAARNDDNWSYIRTIRFAASNSSKVLESLITSLERRADILDRHIIQMDRKYLQSPNQGLPIKPALYGASKQRQVRILFVDDRNRGRSVLAQGYAQLLREWTLRTHNPWFISTIHSSGLHVRDTTSSGLSILQDRLDLPALSPGGTPGWIALSSLFDHPTLNTHYKRTLNKQLKTQRARGLSNTTFNAYDYIFVFNFRDNVSLQKLKAMMRKSYGGYAAPRAKARIVMLGEYGNRSSSEIYGVPKDVVDDGLRRREWDRVMGQIRVSFRGWLREELGWEKPEEGGT